MSERPVLNAPYLVYTYDGTYEGLLTAIFELVYARVRPNDIFPAQKLQTALNTDFVEVTTDRDKAQRVQRSIYDTVGSLGAKRLYYLFLSSYSQKERIFYQYLMLAYRNKNTVNSALANDTVLLASQIAQNVSRETERYRGFLRFAVMEGGVQYAKFAPNNDLLPLLVPYFADRLRTIPFILHDTKREQAAFYDCHDWYISSSAGLTPPDVSEDEAQYRMLWDTFFETITIKERTNRRLQRQMMPLRYFRA